MNFLSRINPKTLLGRKLSNRYLSRDAFTSGGRGIGRGKIRRVGTAFRGGRSLLEIKFTVMRVISFVLLLIILLYSITTFRYGIHRFLSKNISPIDTKMDLNIELTEGEFFVAPKYLTTDTFIADVAGTDVVSNTDIGALVSEAYTDTPVGMVESVADNVIISLFSNPGFKHHFFIQTEDSESVEIVDLTTSVSTSSDEVNTPSHKNPLAAVLFEGAGYGEITAKLPPQTSGLTVGGMVYIQTTKGPKPVAHISRISTDVSSGSTFTIVNAQLLVAPQSIFKMKVQ